MPQVLRRDLEFHPQSGIAADAAIPCTLATTTPVLRDGMLEVLDCTPQGCDLSRGDLPLIVAHDQSQLAVGVVTSIQATGDRVAGMVRFASNPQAQQILADVVAGIHRHLSVGYIRQEPGVPNGDGLMVYRWTPVEVSIVPVPADPNAGFFRSLTNERPIVPDVITSPAAPARAEQSLNAAQAVQVEQQRAAAITDICTRHGVGHLAVGMISAGTQLDDARTAVLNELARRDAASGGHLNVRSFQAATNTAQEREVIVNTLAARMGCRAADRPTLRNLDCVGLAQRSLELAGVQVDRSWSRADVIERAFGGAHTTSDFGGLLGAAARRVLHEAYEAAPSALKTVARQVNAADFRERSVVRLGGAPSLEKVNEHGEFRYGTINEATATWKLATYGRIFSVSRQALVNDDLGGFADVIRKFGDAASDREAVELVSLLVSPPQIDGADLFSVARNSLVQQALGFQGLAAAVLALRQQKDIDGMLKNQRPATLIVPAALEAQALQLVGDIKPTQTANVQPYRFTVLVEPRLDAASATAWYLVAGNQTAMEYGYLDGSEGPQITQREGFEVDGLEIKARLDFGCGWGAPLGWVKGLPA